MPTLNDVAAMAGVSRATVSRVVNGDTRVQPGSQQAVEEAIAALGYVPNRAARALASRRTDAVALVVPHRPDDLFDQPFFGSLAGGIQTRLGELGRELVLLLGGGPEEMGRAERYLLSGHVDGAVVVGLQGSERLAARLSRQHVPVVVWGRPVHAPGVPWVDTDNIGGARHAVEMMIAERRRHIAHLSGPLDTAAGADRLAGYREAIEAVGMTEHVIVCDFRRDSAIKATRDLVAGKAWIDGIVAGNDVMAAAALAVLADAGRSVPADVAVVGFDDSAVARATRPTLTSVRQPTELIGRAVVDMLMSVLAGDPVTPVVLPTELVRRESF